MGWLVVDAVTNVAERGDGLRTITRESITSGINRGSPPLTLWRMKLSSRYTRYVQLCRFIIILSLLILYATDRLIHRALEL